VAAEVASLWGTDSPVEIDEGVHVHEAPLLSLDSRKAELRLGWRNAIPFHDALAWTVSWEKAVRAGQDARTVTIAQISELERLSTRGDGPPR
jgi:CDP-glucose 4,6-dehydratase